MLKSSIRPRDIHLYSLVKNAGKGLSFPETCHPLRKCEFRITKKLVDMDIESVTAIFDAESDKIDLRY